MDKGGTTMLSKILKTFAWCLGTAFYGTVNKVTDVVRCS